MKHLATHIAPMLALIALLSIGLTVDSTHYRQALAAGWLTALPMYLLAYSLPNWILLAVIATYLGDAYLNEQADLMQTWNRAVFKGVVLGLGVVFGGTYINADEMLAPSQLVYLKIAGVIALTAFNIGAGPQQVVAAFKRTP